MKVPSNEAAPKIIWTNLLFFVFTTLIAAVGAPLYLLRCNIHPFYLWLTLFYALATGMSISAGYHRLFSHVTYKAHPVIRFLFLFFGAAAFEQSALRWASQHRDHHAYVATDRDPYNIKKGFFYAHIGWLVFWEIPTDYSNAKDLTDDPMIAHQHRYYLLWALGAGVLTPMLIGLLYGDLLAALIFPVCLRIVIIHQATFCVNSVCHTFGAEPYDSTSTARDNWAVAMITNGEGYHNYHHRFPSDYRNGIYWYQWDSAKWLIKTLNLLGLTLELKKMSKFGILLARLKTNQQKLRQMAADEKRSGRLTEYYSDTERSYNDLKARLLAWEEKSKEYGKLAHSATEVFSKLLRRATKRRVNTAKLRYRHAAKQRKRYTSSS